MFSYLQRPVTEKSKEKLSNAIVECCATSMQGWRTVQEDQHLISLDIDQDVHCFAVFDGHGGKLISSFLKTHFIDQLKSTQEYQNKDYIQALKTTFIELDSMIKTHETKNTFVGSTAIVALMAERILYVANLGDSRCLLQRDEETIELSKDHLPTDESSRIVKAGGFVDENGRVNATLAVSRAFGDFEFKSNEALPQSEQMVIAIPEIRKVKLSKDDSFLFLACDGVFEILNNYKIMQFIQSRIDKHQPIDSILEQLLDTSIGKTTQSGYGCDNMTAMIVKFK